jgi:hypothetical protein
MRRAAFVPGRRVNPRRAIKPITLRIRFTLGRIEELECVPFS